MYYHGSDICAFYPLLCLVCPQRSAIRSLGQTPTDAELQQLINKFDLEGNGSVDVTEFMFLMSQNNVATTVEDQKQQESEKKAAFRLFDTVCSNSVSPSFLWTSSLLLGNWPPSLAHGLLLLCARAWAACTSDHRDRFPDLLPTLYSVSATFTMCTFFGLCLSSFLSRRCPFAFCLFS